MKTLERGSNDLIEHMGDLVIKNNELQEENLMLMNDLIDLNKYDSEKYKMLDRTFITKYDKNSIEKKIFGINYKGERQRVMSREAVTEEIFQLRPLPNGSNKIILIIDDERFYKT
jgi:hypothetical protein